MVIRVTCCGANSRDASGYSSQEISMKFTMLAFAATLAVGAWSGAMAQYVCPPGYTYYGGVCQPSGPVGYSKPRVGRGEASGAAAGYAACGPVGAVIGGALGTATGAVGGAGNMVGRAA